jgi:hypothetical protein
MQVNFGLLDPNAFERGRQNALAMFEQGREQAKQRKAENALNALAANPEDPQAVAGFIAADPVRGMQYRQQLSEQQRLVAEREREENQRTIKIFGRAAKLAKDPASWDAIIDQLGPQYPEVMAYRGKFDPNMRAALMAQAGESDDEAQEPSFIREARALGIGMDEARQLWKTKQGTVMIDGIPHVMLPSGGSPASGQAKPIASKAEYDALPPGAEYVDPTGQVRRKGGAGPAAAPGTFQP